MANFSSPARCARRALIVALLALALHLPTLHAQTTLKPLPSPDLAALDEANRTQMIELRRLFEERRAVLVGEPLAEAYAQLGGFYARFGVNVAALAAIDNALVIAPEDGRFHYLRAAFLAADNQAEPARLALLTAARFDSEYFPIRLRLAEAEVARGDLAAARAVLAPLTAAGKEQPTAQAMLAQIALSEKRNDEAINLFQAALRADPAATSLYNGLAQALDAAGRAADASAARAKAGTVPVAYADPLLDGIYGPAPQPADVTALAMANAGKHTEALALIASALEQAPDSPRLYAVRARIEADRNQPAAAKAAIERAVALAPDDAAVLLSQGLIAELDGDNAGAQRAYMAALNTSTDVSEARLALGVLLQRQRRYAEAFEQFRALGQSAGSVGWARAAAVASLSDRCGDALGAIDAAAKANPRDGNIAQILVRVVASCQAASAAQKQAALTTAQALYRQSASADHAEALAMIHAALGQFTEALEFQAQAGFELVKEGGTAAAQSRQPLMQAFEAKQAASTPWPVTDPVMQPPTLGKSVTASGR